MEILIVDDDRGLVEFVSVALRRAGFTVTRAYDAPSVNRRMQEASLPDLILLDINLGAWNGFDLLRDLRSRSQIPVILLTGRASEDDKITGLEVGADDYVSRNRKGSGRNGVGLWLGAHHSDARNCPQ
ncbi:MAG: DNA-binding response regulator [Chloroflexi bacterium]|nr:DNA-binding response regulator [Chloroflexota bacterium]